MSKKDPVGELASSYIFELSCLIAEVGKNFADDAEITSAIRKYKIAKETFPDMIIKRIGKIMANYEKEITRAKNDDGILKIDFDEVLKLAKDADDKLVKYIFTKIQAYINGLQVEKRIEYCIKLLKLTDLYKQICKAKAKP
jgi:hypothetical protein